jgi:oxalate decarboxylase/phosphoglucose isomerase-like protein (cupin superfamily)
MFEKHEQIESLSAAKLPAVRPAEFATVLRSQAMQVIESPTCGQLTLVSPTDRIPNIDQVLAKGLSATVGHEHETFGEDYFVLQGSLLVVTQDATKGGLSFHELHQGDRLLIPPNTGHKVLDGSSDNLVLVSSFPKFDPGDEKISPALEGTDFAILTGRVSFDAREKLRQQDRENSERALTDMAGW